MRKLKELLREFMDYDSSLVIKNIPVTVDPRDWEVGFMETEVVLPLDPEIAVGFVVDGSDESNYYVEMAFWNNEAKGLYAKYELTNRGHARIILSNMLHIAKEFLFQVHRKIDRKITIDHFRFTPTIEGDKPAGRQDQRTKIYEFFFKKYINYSKFERNVDMKYFLSTPLEMDPDKPLDLSGVFKISL